MVLGIGMLFECFSCGDKSVHDIFFALFAILRIDKSLIQETEGIWKVGWNIVIRINDDVKNSTYNIRTVWIDLQYIHHLTETCLH